MSKFHLSEFNCVMDIANLFFHISFAIVNGCDLLKDFLFFFLIFF
uniref:Uncharacterized protein n=1 Tax=Rhizophora mucronata TaxID=61149 RepID=A0A2P2NZ60_RHIMU